MSQPRESREEARMTPNIEKLQALYNELADSYEGKFVSRKRLKRIHIEINTAFKAETGRDYDMSNAQDIREMSTFLATTYEGPPSREMIDHVMEVGMREKLL
jgi:hypothetical protein